MTEDLYPAYIAFIRRELELAPGADTLVELSARLAPDDPHAKPPFRAPGIVRLRRALRRLQQQQSPDMELDQFAEDLRFLQLFAIDGPVLPEEAMRKLLADVMNSPPIRKATGSSDDSGEDNVVPFRSRAPKPGEPL